MRLAGRLRAARERVEAALARPEHSVAPILSRLVLAQDAVVVAAAASYVTGYDCGFFTEEERAADAALAGEPLPRVGMVLLGALLQRIEPLEDPEARAAYLTDPAFAPLRATPFARCVFASTWQRPHREVWPDLHLETRDAAFDLTFDLHTWRDRARPPGTAAPRPAWIAQEQGRRRTPGEAWAFRWRCALLAPYLPGGGPYRAALLQDPAQVLATGWFPVRTTAPIPRSTRRSAILRYLPA